MKAIYLFQVINAILIYYIGFQILKQMNYQTKNFHFTAVLDDDMNDFW